MKIETKSKTCSYNNLVPTDNKQYVKPFDEQIIWLFFLQTFFQLAL